MTKLNGRYKAIKETHLFDHNMWTRWFQKTGENLCVFSKPEDRRRPDPFIDVKVGDVVDIITEWDRTIIVKYYGREVEFSAGRDCFLKLFEIDNI